MKTLILIFATMLLLTGCREVLLEPDMEPPSPPRGLATYPGDNVIEVDWISNTEYDVAGYHVYASATQFGTYELIGTTRTSHFIDDKVHNGDTWFYTVSAFDDAGNESPLSPEIISEVARPEGRNVSLGNYLRDPGLAGYDFSTYSIGPYEDKYTDIFFEYTDGVYYMDVWEDTDIQDLGYTSSLYSIEDMPTKGWSPSKDVKLIIGHTYVVWTWDNHFAKFRVTGLSPSRVTFEWAYQLQTGNPRLKANVTERGALRMGAGAASRRSASATGSAVQ